VEYPDGKFLSVFPRIVDDHYLQAMQVPLRAGRFFDSRDTATSQKTVIINEHLAASCGRIETRSASRSPRTAARR
jgi:hypothetical protein